MRGSAGTGWSAVGWLLAALLIGAPAAHAGWLPEMKPSTAGSGWTGVAMQPGGDIDAVWHESAVDGVTSVIRWSRRPAGGEWTAPVTLGRGLRLDIATNAAGDGVIVFESLSGTLEGVTRTADGPWSEPVEIAPTAAVASMKGLAVAIDPAGNAVVAWTANDGQDLQNTRANAAYRPAGGPFGPPTALSPDGDSPDVDVAIDDEGNAIVVWRRREGTAPGIEMSTHPPAGTFSAPALISAEGAFYGDPVVATGPGGAALVTWWGGAGPLASRYRPPGGVFGPVEPLHPLKTSRAPAGFDAAGNLTVVFAAGGLRMRTRAPGEAWGETTTIPGPVEATRPSLAVSGAGDLIVGFDILNEGPFGIARPAGGAFAPAVRLEQVSAGIGNGDADGTRAAIDAEGNGVIGWWRLGGAQPGVYVAGYDAVAPRATATSIPATGTAGVPVAFSVSAFDVWSAAPAAWDFGDGSTATGNDTTHTYAQPGTYPITATLADESGNTRPVSGSITITAAPVPPPTGGTSSAATISELRLTPPRFRVRTGTTVSYRIDQPATVRFTVQRATRGRRSGSRCAKRTRRNRQGKRCTRFVKVKGAITRERAAGPDSFRFKGRLRGRKLRPGRYRLTATPVSEGRPGSPARRAFRILS